MNSPRKGSPRTIKMEPTGPKVPSRYLTSPTGSCHDHCKPTTPTTPTKPINPLPKRISKPHVDSVPKVTKPPSVIPKITTRSSKNDNVVKDQTSKKDIKTEPKKQDFKLKSVNSQAKTNNRTSPTTPRRRLSDVCVPKKDMSLPSPRFPKRRLSDVPSVSNGSMARGSGINKNESRKESKLPSANKKSSTLKTSASTSKLNTRVSPLRSYRSIPKPELKGPKKTKPVKPNEEIVPEETRKVIEPNNDVEITKCQTSSNCSLSSYEVKVMLDDQNETVESSPPSLDGPNVMVESSSSSLEDVHVVGESSTPSLEEDQNVAVESSTPSLEEDQNVAVESLTSSLEDAQNVVMESSPPSLEQDQNVVVESSPASLDDQNVSVESSQPSSNDQNEVVEYLLPSLEGDQNVAVESSPPSLEEDQNVAVETSPPSLDDQNVAPSIDDQNEVVESLPPSLEDGQNEVVESSPPSIDDQNAAVEPDDLVVESLPTTLDEQNVVVEFSPPSIEYDTIAKDGQQNDNVSDSILNDTKDTKHVEKLVSELNEYSVDDLSFKRGTILSPKPVNNRLTELQFKKSNKDLETETEKGENISLRRLSSDGDVVRISESQTISVDLKHQEVEEKKEAVLSNNVIEETASKLIQTRKSKVKALVGAFETIVSSDSPPKNTHTSRGT